MKNSDIKILIVDDEEIVRESLTGWFEEDGYTVDNAADAVQALNKLNDVRWDIYFLDIKMPGMDGLELQRRIKEIDDEAICVIITAYASVDTAVQALKEGAFDYITKPFDPENLSHLIRNAVKQRRLSMENISLKESLNALTKIPEIIGSGPDTEQMRRSIETIAPTNTTVMIRGESGTGKELVAQNIHALSTRRFFPMVTVNCGALSESLLESELFGHEKGAFTGALYRRKGKLEIANGGTLFLDEVGTISPKTQIDLLRAIEEKKFTRLGGNEIIESDFRLICATNTDLEEAVKKMTFREDLYYRLQVFVITLKPLRERREDMPELVNYFIKKYREKMNKQIVGIDSAAMEMLLSHPWPGNVRELENAIESAMVICTGNKLRQDDFTLHSSNKIIAFSPDQSLKAVEKKHILNVLEKNHWNIAQAARVLGVDRVTIYKKLRQYGITRPQDV